MHQSHQKHDQRDRGDNHEEGRLRGIYGDLIFGTPFCERINEFDQRNQYIHLYDYDMMQTGKWSFELIQLYLV